MGLKETIIELLCVFLIAILGTGVLCFLIYFGDIFATVVWFGISTVLWLPCLIMIMGVFGAVAILMWMFYRESSRRELRFTPLEIILYVLLSLAGILFIILTHPYLLPGDAEMQNILLDTLILLEFLLFTFIIGILVSVAKEEVFTIVKLNYHALKGDGFVIHRGLLTIVRESYDHSKR